MDQFSGRTAVVTGAASGIGRGLALALAGEGMNVVVADIEAGPVEEVARSCRERGVRSIALPVDVSSRAAVASLAEAAYREFGGVHLLCSNAGVMPRKPLLKMTEQDWEWVLSVNFFGAVNGIAAFVPRMLAQGGEGHILITASMSGLAPVSGSTIGGYIASKFAVVGLAEVLRVELAPSGIGVSVLCPGAVQTQIGGSERNRPQELGGGAVAPTAVDSQVQMAERSAVTGMRLMHPDQAARIALEGVRKNRLYIVTHASERKRAAARFDAILESFAYAE